MRRELISLKEVSKRLHSFAHMYKSLCSPLFFQQEEGKIILSSCIMVEQCMVEQLMTIQ